MAKFIVIDGLDGCGKATQSKLLKEHLEKLGKKVYLISFPNYGSDSSAPIKMYLNNQIVKDLKDVNIYACASFYAVDRYITYKRDLEKIFKEDDNTYIIADRYISANIIHQGGKIEGKKERELFIDWIFCYEYDLIGLPKEDVTILLTMQSEAIQKLLNHRYNGDNNRKDIHEADSKYLDNCYNRLKDSIEYINNKYDLTYKNINIYNDDNIDTIEVVHNKIKEALNV